MGKRVQQRTAQSDVLPAGKFVSNVEFKENSKTVSKPHALPMFRKSPQTVHTTQSTIFDPPQPIQQRTEVTKAGKALHSDPFDATRQDADIPSKKDDFSRPDQSRTSWARAKSHLSFTMMPRPSRRGGSLWSSSASRPQLNAPRKRKITPT